MFKNCKTFNRLDNLTSLEIINDETFMGCDSIIKLNIKINKYIGKNAFANCKNLDSLKVSCSEIGESAFSGCKSLNYVMLTNPIISINDFAFGECSAIKIIKFPDDLESIGVNAFISCTSFKEIVIPNKVKKSAKVPSKAALILRMLISEKTLRQFIQGPFIIALTCGQFHLIQIWN